MQSDACALNIEVLVFIINIIFIELMVSKNIMEVFGPKSNRKRSESLVSIAVPGFWDARAAQNTSASPGTISVKSDQGRCSSSPILYTSVRLSGKYFFISEQVHLVLRSSTTAETMNGFPGSGDLLDEGWKFCKSLIGSIFSCCRSISVQLKPSLWLRQNVSSCFLDASSLDSLVFLLSKGRAPSK